MTSYCGINMTQLWDDLYLWEQLFNENSDIDVVVELGTAYGGMSLFLMHQAELRGAWFYTVDNIDHSRDPIDQHFGRPDRQMKTAHQRIMAGARSIFGQVDVLSNPEMIQKVLGQATKPVLFCDNGHKVREVELFEPYVAQGGFVVVHDWMTEIFPENIPSSLEPIDWLLPGSDTMTAFFQKL